MNANMSKVNMDKFIQGFENLKKNEFANCKCYKSGALFYIIKSLGEAADSHIVWSMSVNQTAPVITIEYCRFNDQLRMPSKKFWCKKEVTIQEITNEIGYSRMALESYYALTITDFLFKQIKDRFMHVVRPQASTSVLKGGLPTDNMCDSSHATPENKRS